jgi:hypothetical protein
MKATAKWGPNTNKWNPLGFFALTTTLCRPSKVPEPSLKELAETAFRQAKARLHSAAAATLSPSSAGGGGAGVSFGRTPSSLTFDGGRISIDDATLARQVTSRSTVGILSHADIKVSGAVSRS